MFRCIDRLRQRDVLLFDYEGDDSALPRLRVAGRSGELVCPECRQPVGVKAGRILAWHFAHKDLGTCPLATESAAVLAARRILYHWLVAKHVRRPGLEPENQAKITVEKKMFADIDRPADCFVEFPGKPGFGYWILDRSLRHGRKQLEDAARKRKLHPVFLSSMLKRTEEDDREFDLSPAERGLMVPTRYDSAYRHGEGSLQYLDCEAKSLITLRALKLKHKPQRYCAARVIVHPLTEMLTDKSGEFIHPGEYERFRQYQKRIAEQEKERQERQRARSIEQKREMAAKAAEVQRFAQRLQKLNAQSFDRPPESNAAAMPGKSHLSDVTRKAMGLLPLRCEKCGVETTTWISASPGHGTCLCRECHGK